MDSIPKWVRFLDYFEDITRIGTYGQPETAWKCRLCGKVITRNSLGGSSHLSMHMGQKLRGEPMTCKG